MELTMMAYLPDMSCTPDLKYKDKVHIHSGKKSSCEKNIDKKENHIGMSGLFMLIMS